MKRRQTFEAFVAAGQHLSDLHTDYETLEPYPVAEIMSLDAPVDEYERYAVTKMKYAGKKRNLDVTTIHYNAFIDIEGIPAEAHDYMIGSRSAVDWIRERFAVTTESKSGIVNDPNDWSREKGQPRYIIDLIGRIVALSLETNRIIHGLPDLETD